MAKKKSKNVATEIFKTIMKELEELASVLEGEIELKERIKYLENCVETLRRPKSIGQYFDEVQKGRHILSVAQDSFAVLISLATGKRWAQPVGVTDLKNINTAEWQEITLGGTFTTVLEGAN